MVRIFLEKKNIYQNVICGETHNVDMKTVVFFKRQIFDFQENYEKKRHT